MGVPDFKNEPFRWNRWYASEYDSDAVNIADDFYVLDKECDYALLSAQYMIKNLNGKKLDPVFSVEEILAASKKAGFKVDTLAIMIDANWKSYVRWKLNDAPVILPPNPEPPKEMPNPDPWAAHPNMPQKPEAPTENPKLPEITLPQNPKEKSPVPWKKILAVAFGILITASAFLPPPYNFLAAGLFKLLQAAAGG